MQVCNMAWSRATNELVSTHGYSQNQVIVWNMPDLKPVRINFIYIVIYYSFNFLLLSIQRM